MRHTIIKPITQLIVAVFSLVAIVRSQDAVPAEMLQRTFLIAVGTEAGTAFAIDHHGKVFLINARHVVAALPPGRTKLKLWRSGNQVDYEIVKTLLPKSANADIAVLETTERVPKPLLVQPSVNESEPAFGQQVWFLGYPFDDPALMTRFPLNNASGITGPLPFIKRATFSALDSSNADRVIVYLDGFNNRGFSGGPVVYWSLNKHEYKILAVISAYRNDTAQMMLNQTKVDTPLLVNSGIIVSYDIRHAIAAIER